MKIAEVISIIKTENEIWDLTLDYQVDVAIEPNISTNNSVKDICICDIDDNNDSYIIGSIVPDGIAISKIVDNGCNFDCNETCDLRELKSLLKEMFLSTDEDIF